MSGVILKKLLQVATVLSLLTGSTSAFAHAHLEHSTPAADSIVSSVDTLQLVFSEGVEQAFSTVSLSQGETPVALSSIASKRNDKKVLIVTPVAPLAAGQYRVQWKVVSVDTHNSNGSYSFTVGH